MPRARPGLRDVAAVAACVAITASVLGFGAASASGAGNCRNQEWGAKGGDRLSGTARSDDIIAGRGADVLRGGPASDCLHAGRGYDRIVAGIGRDRISAGRGRDVVRARDGVRDAIHCGAGHDRAIVDQIDRSSGCERTGPSRTRHTQGSQGSTPQPSTRPPSVNCDPSTLGVQLQLPGCTQVFHDTAADSDPHPTWASVQCASSTRYRYMTSGGDLLATATGALQNNHSFRRMTVQDGDNFWGERCELGRNDWRTSPTAIYHEGQHRVTFMSLHLPSNFPLSTTTWQVVMQMKQSQPSNNGGGTPVLSLEARANRWRLMQSNSVDFSSNTHQLWSAPAQTGYWTRFAFDVIYSQHASAGYVKAYVDLDGDGDATDAGEQSSGLHTYTLKRETSNSTYLKAGDSITSQLRVGIYHNSTISCPSGCSVDVDNVQVLNAP